MRAQLLCEKGSDRRSVHVPDAHVQIYLMKSGREEWVVASFRTDGRYRVNKGSVPTTQYLEMTCDVVAELEVPQHIVDFAVESERLRHEAVDEIADLLERAVTNKDPRTGFRELLGTLEHKNLAQGKNLEQEIGEELHQLLAQTRGQQ